jgi:prepilin-type N-terminal cleavage/methylation domain-containing protein
MRNAAQHVRNGAFTIVELVLTMAIMAVLAAIAIPRYSSAIASYRVRAAAQRLVHDVAQVQSLARSSSSSRAISFERDRYTVANMNDLDTAASSYTVLLTADPYDATIETATLDTGGKLLTFNGYGVPDGGGTIAFKSGTSTRAVVIDAITGKAVAR